MQQISDGTVVLFYSFQFRSWRRSGEEILKKKIEGLGVCLLTGSWQASSLRKHPFDPSKKKKNFYNKCIKTKSKCAPEIKEEEWRSSLNPKPCRTLETLRTDAFSTVRVGNLYCPDLRASSGARRRRERGSLESEPGLTCVQSHRPKSWTKQPRHRIPSLADPPACSFFPWSRERERDGSWSIVAMAKSVWSTSFLLLLLASTLLLQQSLTLVTGNRFPPTLSSRAEQHWNISFSCFCFLRNAWCIVRVLRWFCLVCDVHPDGSAGHWRARLGFGRKVLSYCLSSASVLCGRHFTILRRAPRKPSFDLSVHLQGGVLYVIHLVL